MRRKLEPVEIADMSAGLNKYSSPSTLQQNELSDSENIRLTGPGKITRRGGMDSFGDSGIEPVAATVDEDVGRAIVPYIRNLGPADTTSSIVDAISLIKYNPYGCIDGGTPAKIVLKDHASSAPSFIPWSTRNYFVRDTGHANLDQMVFMGTPYNTVTAANVFPYDILVFFSGGVGGVGTVVTGDTSGAVGTVGMVGSANLHMLYSWNGIAFSSGETVNNGAITAVTPSIINGCAGLVFEHGNSNSDTDWTARKWGITKSLTAITGAGNGTGVVEAGTYNVKYTYMHVDTPVISAGDNPKLTSGDILSESAPSPVQTIVAAGSTKIRYTDWDESPDPQANVIRIYRTDSFSTDYKHVADKLMAVGNVDDNYSQLDVQFQPVILDTDGFRVFGEDGENSGFAVEAGNHRIYVAGNETYPNRIYMSYPRIEHKYSEYFSSSIDISDSTGQSIMAIKYWNETLFIFLQDAVYRLTETTIIEEVFDSYQVITKGIGCSTRNGVIDMGDYLLVMSERGLVQFNGTSFGQVPLTLKVDDVLGNDLKTASMTKTVDYILISTETSRSLNLMVTIKYSDGSFAVGTDSLDSTITMPEAIGYVPELKNYGNNIDNSRYVLGLFQNPNDDYKYFIGKYDLAGSNLDTLFATAGNTSKTIIAKFSPQVFDFGGFNEATLREFIAYISSCGDSDSNTAAPSGQFLVRCYLNRAPSGDAMKYEEILLEPQYVSNKIETANNGNPIQPKYTRLFDGTYKHQTGGVWSTEGGNPNAMLADVQQVLYRGSIPSNTTARLWKLIFEYSAANNFEFLSFALKFTMESGK